MPSAPEAPEGLHVWGQSEVAWTISPQVVMVVLEDLWLLGAVGWQVRIQGLPSSIAVVVVLAEQVFTAAVVLRQAECLTGSLIAVWTSLVLRILLGTLRIVVIAEAGRWSMNSLHEGYSFTQVASWGV